MKQFFPAKKVGSSPKSFIVCSIYMKPIRSTFIATKMSRAFSRDQDRWRAEEPETEMELQAYKNV